MKPAIETKCIHICLAHYDSDSNDVGGSVL